MNAMFKDLNFPQTHSHRCRVSRVTLAFILLFIMGISFSAAAQNTRADVIALQKAKKAQELHPIELNKAQRLLQRLQNNGLLGGTPTGFFPALGSAYRTGGLAGGAGYYRTLGDGGNFSVLGLWSIRNYKLAEANLRVPLASRRIKIDVLGQYLDAPRIPFYGVGFDSNVDNKTNFLYRPTTFGATATISPVRWFNFGGGADYFDVHTGQGSGTPITDVFPPDEVPGFGASPTYTRSRLFAEIDWRQSPGYTASGGWYRADWTDYDQTNEGNFSFREFDAEVRQMFPILRANWVIAVRALVSVTDVDEGQVVPFFLLPNLGGGRDLRGYPDFRFRDRNRILWSVEYRWLPSKFMDMVLFYEAGKVTAKRSDLDFDGLKNSYGIGARFHGPTNTAIRLEVARSEEGTRYIFAFSPSW